MVLFTFFPRLPGGVRACQDGLGHFFPLLPEGERACQDDFGHFFSTFARLTEGGGLKLFGQCPYRANTFQKGASLTIWKGQHMYSYFFKFFCNISFIFNQLKMCTFISLLEPGEVLTWVILGCRALARVGIGKHARRNLISESNPLLIFSI